ncbi:hypothetical protein [Actinokineospora iranica]|uniref:LPXTG-motif cell wall anchor domain-containing protein n=1 Tax=Actinokineospora iranica TaxID=1271860 RepID=A0A1G6TS57_9PSEU|nr:hypothetical protein [Actinokineospora iranica]SDD31227.1 hypothetical protein SAMN05216174_109260 [Actinokineospora iranica]
MRTSMAAFGVAVSTAALFAFLPLSASATPGDPVSDDPRATVHAGNVESEGDRDDCPKLWEGSVRVTVTATADPTNTYLDITDVPDNVDLAGVIVKGGDAYNKYDADKLGDGLDLRSPLAGNSGKPATISHWFACGAEGDTETTTSEPTTPTSPTSTTSAPEVTVPTEPTTPSGTTSASAPVTTTTTTSAAAAVGAGDDGELADTGANVGWLAFIAAALVLGGAVLLTPRLRNALLRRS